jgi:hypothetical protein
MITLTEERWVQIRKQLKAEYGWKPSVLLIRETMKRELGFTIRSHEHWVDGGDLGSGYRITMYLDFYDEAAETFFRMKYL